jgi:release factor glutamine methyltransferase
MIFGEWLKKGEARLSVGPHAERAKQDAELLLRHVTGLDRAALLTRGTEALSTSMAATYGELLERRLGGEPIQYIVGETEFYGLRFRVNRDVLIPRPETEHLVEKAIALAERFERARIVDVGTGSGAIAVALAHALIEAEITAVDVSDAALAVAKENAQLNGVERRIRWRSGDLLEGLAERFEIVVSNPPYVPGGDRDSMAVEVREYEPGLALFAGEDGLDVYRRLIPASFDALVSGGWIALEIGYGQAAGVGGLLEASGFVQVEFTRDLQGIERVAAALRV